MDTATMTKSAMIRARMEPDLKNEAESVLKNLGLSTTDFINMAYRQLVMRKALPFEARVFNDETVAIIEENRQAYKDGKMNTFASSDEAMAWLEADESD